MSLEKYLLHSLPGKIYCIPNFINENEESQTLKKIYEAPKIKWTTLLNRKLQNWGGLPSEKGMIAEDIPNWLQCHINKIQDLSIFEEHSKPNHVLINEYLPGQGISPHLDGNLFYPTIATISLGSHTVLNFYEPLSESDKMTSTCPSLVQRLKFKVYVPQRSLILIQDKMFHHYLHGIEELLEDDDDDNLNIPPDVQFVAKRSTRVSLTIRHVPKTRRIKIKL